MGETYEKAAEITVAKDEFSFSSCSQAAPGGLYLAESLYGGVGDRSMVIVFFIHTYGTFARVDGSCTYIYSCSLFWPNCDTLGYGYVES